MTIENKSIMLFEALGNVDDELIELCENMTTAKKKSYTKYITMAACLCIVITVFIISSQRGNTGDISVQSENTGSTNLITLVPDENELDVSYYTSSENTTDIDTATMVTETTEATAEINIAIPKFEPMPKPFENVADGGGDRNYVFYQTVTNGLELIIGEFSDLVGWTEFQKWMNIANTRTGNLVSIDKSANVYSFINYFNIPDETVREILVNDRERIFEYGFNDVPYFTDEEIDLLLSDNAEKVAEYYVTDSAIRKGKNIYSLNWIYSHSIIDYMDNNITAEDIERIRPYYDDLMLTDEAKAALNEKLDFFVNMKR